MLNDAVLTEEEVEEGVKETADKISAVRRSQGSASGKNLKAEVLAEKMLQAKDDLKEVKNALKAYRVTNEKIVELSAAKKELVEQINEQKEEIEAQFAKDGTYNKLREEKLDAEEKIAIAKQELKMAMMQQAGKDGVAEVEFQYNGVPLKVQSQLTVMLFMNGKEEK